MKLKVKFFKDLINEAQIFELASHITMCCLCCSPNMPHELQVVMDETIKQEVELFLDFVFTVSYFKIYVQLQFD